MGTVVNIYDAKTHLSRLIADVEKGAEVVIGRHGRPVAKLVPYEEPRTDRTPGAFAGQITIGDDFDAWTSEDDAAWYGTAP